MLLSMQNIPSTFRTCTGDAMNTIIDKADSLKYYDSSLTEPIIFTSTKPNQNFSLSTKTKNYNIIIPPLNFEDQAESNLDSNSPLSFGFKGFVCSKRFNSVGVEEESGPKHTGEPHHVYREQLTYLDESHD